MNMWPVPDDDTHSNTPFIGMPSSSFLLGLVRSPFYFLTLLPVYLAGLDAQLTLQLFC